MIETVPLGHPSSLPPFLHPLAAAPSPVPPSAARPTLPPGTGASHPSPIPSPIMLFHPFPHSTFLLHLAFLLPSLPSSPASPRISSTLSPFFPSLIFHCISPHSPLITTSFVSVLFSLLLLPSYVVPQPPHAAYPSHPSPPTHSGPINTEGKGGVSPCVRVAMGLSSCYVWSRSLEPWPRRPPYIGRDGSG